MKKNYLTHKAWIFFFILVSYSLTFKAQIVQTFNYTGAIQTFTVPPCVFTMTIQARGAQGGYNTASAYGSGLGAVMTGVFNVTPGQVLKVLVGQQPSANAGNGGGGGSYVTTSANAPMIIAGGGGGSCGTGDTPNKHGQSGTAGGQAGAANGGIGGIGGTNGNGGALGTNTSWTAGAGGGLLTDGAGPAASAGANSFGKAFLIGGAGGIGSSAGGFGGGGSGSLNHVGGGGGGYSGGGGGANDGGCGGGGGSFNGGTNQVNVTGSNTGNGVVTFSYTQGAPVAVNISPAFICVGGTATLTAQNMATYTWSPMNANTSSITVSPSTTTNYTIEGTSAAGCASSMIVTVPVNTAVPSLTINNTAVAGGICPNSTVILTASGANTYTWTGGTTSVTNGIVFKPTTAADYTVQAENGCGITTGVTSVSVHPFPTVNPSASSTTLCAGTSLSLTATGNATNYVWSGGNAPGGNGVGFFPPAATLAYTVIGTSALGCTAQATMPVTIHATPQQSPVATPSLVCIGNSSTLTATGASNYTWTNGVQTGNSATFVVTPSGPGVTTYTVIKANSTCSDTKTISVTTNALPSIFAIANPNVICALQPSTLSIGGGISYTWTAPGTPNFTFTGASPVVYPGVSSDYSVAASDGTCVAYTTVSVTTNPNPTITTTASSPSVCIGQQVTMNAFGGNSYTWTATSGTFYTQSITDSPTTAVAYNVTGDNNFGCTSSAQQIVLVYPLPPTNAAAAKPLACSGGSVLLTASGANTYTWDASAGGAVSQTVVVFPTNSTSGLVTYTVTGSFANTGCSFSKTVQVGVYVPTLSVSGNTIACVGGQISLTSGGGNPNSYTWNTGTQTTTFPSLTTTLAAPAVFTVSAMSTSMSVVCPATRTIAVDNYSVPVITAVAERSLICPKESTQLFASGGVSYNWSNSQSGATISIAPVAQTNNYTVTGTDANNCAGTGSVQVKLQNCTGIAEQGLTSAGLLVYPNPNNGAFTIQAPSEMTLLLSNELGQHIRTVTLSAANNYSASVGELDAGIYFLSGNGAVQLKQKVIVTR